MSNKIFPAIGMIIPCKYNSIKVSHILSFLFKKVEYWYNEIILFASDIYSYKISMVIV